jgi:hypothetical protein
MLSEEFAPEELLFRAIVHSVQWDYDEDRPSSAAFKDSLGTSVDRQHDRAEDECIDFVLSHFPNPIAIACFTVAKCIEYGAKPVYAPLPENRYHSVLHRPDGTIRLSGGTLKKFKSVKICYKRSFL